MRWKRGGVCSVKLNLRPESPYSTQPDGGSVAAQRFFEFCASGTKARFHKHLQRSVQLGKILAAADASNAFAPDDNQLWRVTHPNQPWFGSEAPLD
jgi:hypothetical protein